MATPLALAAVTVRCPVTKEKPDQRGRSSRPNAWQGSMTGRQVVFLCIKATVAMVATTAWIDRLGILDGEFGVSFVCAHDTVVHPYVI